MKPIIFNEASKIWTKYSHGDMVVSRREFELEIQNKLLNIFRVGEFYYYIINLKDLRFEFVSKEVKDVLGYEPEEMDLQTYLSLVHPEDQSWLLNIENKAGDFFETLSLEQMPNYKVRYDYRVRKKNGEYIRLLQQAIIIDLSSEGGIIRTLGVHTDISHLKMNGSPVLSFIGMNGEPSYYDVDIKKVFPVPSGFLSYRENEIISLLLTGMDSKQIAEKLFISVETVSTHRKNILKKTKARNTSELIAMAIRNGWV
jgi:DNA-binding CsgD family transcriptional regulator